MSFAQSIIVFFVQPVLWLILAIFFAYVILSWLFTLNIVQPHNQTARTIYSILASVVEPIVAPFRKIIPPLGNFDMGFFFAAMLLYWTYIFLIPKVVLPALG
jgi:YggT family protein